MTSNINYHEEPIEPFIWCVLSSLHIPLRLCKACKFHGGIHDKSIHCEYFYGNDKEYDHI